MKIIDLSHEIYSDMPVTDGDAKVEIRQTSNMEQGFNTYLLSCGMHSATHVDMPLHMLDGKPFALDYPINDFITNAAVFDVKAQAKEGLIDFLELGKINRGDTVILNTGFHRVFGRKTYFSSFPVLSPGLANSLVKKGIKSLALDSPSPDKSPYNIHKILLESSIFIFENLNNLNKLESGKSYKFYAVPLKIRAEASLVRAFAVEN